jgi:LuxR family maltose regulon positive regulatory protein
MSAPVLTTKLYIPQPRANLVPRPHLVERVNAGLQRRLTLISAPAGFGKTTLLSEWVHSETRPQNCPKVAWVSLDRGDNDPTRFWVHVVAALQRGESIVGETALEALRSAQPPPIETLLSGLINEIAAIPDTVALVLDDYHVITTPPIDDAVSFLLDNMPPQMHLIVSSRADPPWPLARLRARGEVAELRVGELRFTADEATAFLNTAMGLELTPDHIAALDSRTEGWIAGLQLAALSLRGQEPSIFINAFSGSHRFILDYLMEEVLDRQPEHLQAFLLKTSILEQLTAPLCDATAERDDSGAVLTQLERANAFLTPLDEERRWYRYHHLFGDLLRSRLHSRYPNQVRALHRRASEWYERNGLLAEAVSHALEAGDEDRVTRLVAENALAMVYHGELKTLLGWLEALPDETVRSRPWLCVAYAWALAYAGHLDAVEQRVQDAERALARDAAGEPAAEARHPAGHVAAIRAFVASFRNDQDGMIRFSRQALDDLPERDAIARSLVGAFLGIALRTKGESEAAARALAEAASASMAAGEIHLGVDVLWELAILRFAQGQLHAVMSICQEALRLAEEYASRSGRRSPVTGYIHSRLSAVLCEWNDLEAALHHAEEGLKLCKQWGQADALTEGYFCLASVLAAVGETDRALETINEAKQLAPSLGRWYTLAAGAREAQIWLAEGNVAAAASWAGESELSIHDELSSTYYFGAYLTLASVLIAQDKAHEAQVLLARLSELIEGAQWTRAEIQLLILQAQAYEARNQTEQALGALERALSLAEPEGFVRIFVQEGTAMQDLLRKAATRGIAVAYVSRLLAESASEVQGRQLASARALPEPLSERELEVLRLLATSLSRAEIAEELFISVNTVRSHVKSIYSKLDVHRRLDAIRRAREIGLL